jgi:hypothetical protein
MVSVRSKSPLVQPLVLHAVPRKQEGSRAKLVWMHATVVAAVALTLYAEDPVMTLIVGGLLVTPVYVWLGIVEARRAPLVFSPLSFYFFWYVVGFGLSPLYVAYVLQRDGSLSFSVAAVPANDIDVGYVLCLVGSVAFHAGMQWVRPLSTELSGLRDKPSTTLKALLMMGAVGIAILIKPERFQALGNIAHPLQVAPVTGLVIFCLLGRKYFGLRRDVFVLMLGAGTAVLFAINLRSGSKAILMFSFLPLLWMVLQRRDLRRWLPALLLILAASYLLVVAPSVTRARDVSLSQGETPVSHLMHSFSVSGPRDSLLGASIPDQVDRFLMRQFDPMPVSFLVGEVRRNGYQMGETMRYASYAFIPRLLWPDKPALTRGAWFYAYVGGSARESEATSSLGITATGELFWNFGVGGVLVGMCAIGCGYATLWRIAGSNPLTQPLHMLLYVLITIIGMIDMPEAVTVFGAICSELLLFGTLFLLFDRRKQKRQIRTRVMERRFPVARAVGS